MHEPISPERKTHAEVVAERLDLDGKTVIDIGCGNGRMTRAMAAQGAHVTGVEPGERQLERALAAPRVADETYIKGGGEDLPFEDASADHVVFFNSLHHVPVDRIADALAEAARVVKPGGTVYVAEPLAEGQWFEFQKPIHDETDVRARAYEALQDAARHGLETVDEFLYVNDAVIESFEKHREASSAILPERMAYIDAHADEIKANLERLGRKDADGYHFDHPMRVNIFRKA